MNTSDKSYTVVLGSNNELWWDGLFLLLKNSTEFKALDICFDGNSVLSSVERFKPDILLIDEELKSGDCSQVLYKIKQSYPNINIILVINPYKSFNLSAVKSIATAFIDKDLTYQELTSCIHHVVKGGMVIIVSPVVAMRLLSASLKDKNVDPTFDVGLSKREKEILIMLSKRGTTNREIAKALFITENTVKAHLSKIMEKMEVHNRQQAAIIAREKGMIPEEFTS